VSESAADDPAYWRALAEARGLVIQALHEFNYWHESSVARGEVIAGLEQSVQMWRDRCERAEAQLAAESRGRSRPAVLLRRTGGMARGQARRLLARDGAA
jgi:hypothetical protein